MILYLDTSSLARSAFARQAREGALTPDEHRRVKASLDFNWQRVLALKVTDEIRLRAGDLTEAYALRGFDGIHLASFLELARSAPGPAAPRFSSFDIRLNQAADAAAQRDGLPPP